MLFDILGWVPKAIDLVYVDTDWSKQSCRIEFIYDPYQDPQVFHLIMNGVSYFSWTLSEKVMSDLLPADVIFLFLGKGNYQETLELVSPSFKIEILYENLYIKKHL